MVYKTAKKHKISYLKAGVQSACPTFLHAELRETITARRRAQLQKHFFKYGKVLDSHIFTCIESAFI